MTVTDIVIVVVAAVAGVTVGLLVLGVVRTVRALAVAYRAWVDRK